MPNAVGLLTRKYLKQLGYKDRQIDTWSDETRLLHDIHLFGDTVLDEFEIMHREFGVDFAAFNFEKHFPSELSWDAFLITVLGWTSFGRRIMDKYRPVTFQMIEAVLVAKKWVHG